MRRRWGLGLSGRAGFGSVLAVLAVATVACASEVVPTATPPPDLPSEVSVGSPTPENLDVRDEPASPTQAPTTPVPASPTATTAASEATAAPDPTALPTSFPTPFPTVNPTATPTPEPATPPDPRAISDSELSEILARVRFPISGWPNTDFHIHNIDLTRVLGGGPIRDGIPPIDDPKFVSVEEADEWIRDNEPVQVVSIDGDVRAYPLQILVWHEIVNDVVGGEPVTITF